MRQMHAILILTLYIAVGVLTRRKRYDPYLCVNCGASASACALKKWHTRQDCCASCNHQPSAEMGN